MNKEEFVERYGGVYEYSPWIAEKASRLVGRLDPPFSVATILAEIVDDSPIVDRLALIRAHPDLAGKAQVAGELTAESTTEQSRAGLDQCTPAEYQEFQSLNEQYKAKFSFPFVMAVRKSNRDEILAQFRERLDNTFDVEFKRAINEIHTIARLRIEAIDAAV